VNIYYTTTTPAPYVYYPYGYYAAPVTYEYPVYNPYAFYPYVYNPWDGDFTTQYLSSLQPIVYQ
jgi:hypothetical protein